MEKIIFFLFLFLSANAFGTESAAEIECREWPVLNFSLQKAAQDINTIKNSLVADDPCAESVKNLLPELEREYKRYYPYKGMITRPVKGIPLSGNEEELDALEKILGRKPPKNWPGVAISCFDVPCAAEKLFGSREAALRALIIQKRDGFTISVSQDHSTDERIFRPEEIRQIDFILQKLPKEFKDSARKTLKEFRRVANTSYDKSLLQNANGYAMHSCNCIEFYDGAFTNHPFVALGTITHEIAHHFDFSNSSISNTEAYRSLGGWGRGQEKHKSDGTAEIEYSRSARKPLVTPYAATSPDEDFAESVNFYVTSPNDLERMDPQKYAFIRSRVFGGKEFRNSLPAELERTLAQKGGEKFIAESCFTEVYRYDVTSAKTIVGTEQDERTYLTWNSLSPYCFSKLARNLAKENPSLCSPSGLEGILAAIASKPNRYINLASQAITANTLPENISTCAERRDYTAKCLSETAFETLVLRGLATSRDTKESLDPFMRSVLNKVPKNSEHAEINALFDPNRYHFEKLSDPSNGFAGCLLERAKDVGPHLFELPIFFPGERDPAGCREIMQNVFADKGIKFDDTAFSKQALAKATADVTEEYWTFYKTVIQPYFLKSGHCGKNGACKAALARSLVSGWGAAKKVSDAQLSELIKLAEMSARSY